MLDKKKVVALVLKNYFEVLIADGLLDKYALAPHDYDYLAGRVLEQIEIGEIEEYERQHEMDLETHD